MQRSITHQKPLTLFAYIFFFVIYESLSSIYLFLPPLLAVLFVLFAKALKSGNTVSVLLVSFCLVVFEAENGYLLFSTIIYFAIVYKFIMPQLNKNFSCNSCINISYVLLAYLGYYLFCILLSNIFMLPMPSINYYIIYYIIIEFFIVSIL